MKDKKWLQELSDGDMVEVLLDLLIVTDYCDDSNTVIADAMEEEEYKVTFAELVDIVRVKYGLVE